MHTNVNKDVIQFISRLEFAVQNNGKLEVTVTIQHFEGLTLWRINIIKQAEDQSNEAAGGVRSLRDE